MDVKTQIDLLVGLSIDRKFKHICCESRLYAGGVKGAIYILPYHMIRRSKNLTIYSPMYSVAQIMKFQNTDFVYGIVTKEHLKLPSSSCG